MQAHENAAMYPGPGQAHDSKHGLEVIGDLRPDLVAMNKAYEREPLMDELRSLGIEPWIPSKNRETPQEYDRQLYKGRSSIEGIFSLLKQFKCVATRYEKAARNYLT